VQDDYLRSLKDSLLLLLLLLEALHREHSAYHFRINFTLSESGWFRAPGRISHPAKLSMAKIITHQQPNIHKRMPNAAALH
jgi:hypothetical protein